MDARGFGRGPKGGLSRRPKRILWGVKNHNVTWSNLVVTWMDTIHMNIVS